ncbi:MAG: flavodoxin-dependent (E)-4-hydroxy-3-methylbut-2-enyl-diphosphate synthase [Christensenellaceae bacterium]|nr:flavodoxin-dependent (E)-4-hydroxy-3-methylbut-2-enyl-diphosphate synthase [Christensenellaceae bacterium]
MEAVMTKKIRIGNVMIGGGEKIAIQSMASTDTADVEASIRQTLQLEEAGCEIIRYAAYDIASAKAIGKIKEGVHIPVVADVHFDHKIAIAAIEAGADKVRINPGNIGGEDKIRMVADAAKMHHIPIRVGANAGSLMEKYRNEKRSTALVESTLENIRALEKCGFYDIVCALKASDVPSTVEAYREISKHVDYPMHLGVTEAGTERTSLIKSAMGIGSLLLMGIGDTLRVTMSADPVMEIEAAKDILQFAGKRLFKPELIACPTCGRTRIDLLSLANEVEALLKNIDKPIKVAVMGCVVNGPGEAREADIGVAGGIGEGVLFKKGEIVKKVPYEEILPELKTLIKEL